MSDRAGGLRDRLIVALDRLGLQEALDHVDRLGEDVALYKVGLELFCASGRRAVESLADRGKSVFLDLKLHDIPATVEGAIRTLRGLPVSLLTVHAAGGPDMLRAAAEAARSLEPAPRVLGVTVLTSLDGAELPALWNPRTGLEEKVLSLARACREAGLAGVVASPRELRALRREQERPFLLVAPGIRGPGEPTQDQKRTLSLREALDAGADYVVVGRPILQAADPVAALAQLGASVAPGPGAERMPT